MTTERIRLSPAVVVEGKYDKIRLETVIDAIILVTDGFRIYKRKEQLALLRHYAETTGLIIMTDADAAGFQIRNYLKSCITTGTLYHVYIPDIHGKERRKSVPSAEGLLGVEGMDRETLLLALQRAGVLDGQPPVHREAITPAILYQLGLSGTPDCSTRRQALLRGLQLPIHLTTKGLCDVLSTMADPASLEAFVTQVLEKEEARP